MRKSESIIKCPRLNVNTYPLNYWYNSLPLLHRLYGSSEPRIVLNVNCTYSFVELNLSVSEATKHFLHLCFLCVLKYGLFLEGFITECVRCLMSGRYSILKLESIQYEVPLKRNASYLLDLRVKLSHLLHSAPVIVSTP